MLLTVCFNPFLIGASSAKTLDGEGEYEIIILFQSPSHRGKRNLFKLSPRRGLWGRLQVYRPSDILVFTIAHHVR